ncbi:MAG: thioredoxin domain-containing protein [Proteobacteria bacterium]|nr:thioredoxin domain-containing protein [Pseudomonadota bacterium]
MIQKILQTIFITFFALNSTYSDMNLSNTDVVDSLTNPFNQDSEPNKMDSITTKASIHAQHLAFVPEVVFGDLKNAKLKITIYSAPTCTHCAEYHKKDLPAVFELVKNKPVVIVMRTFIANLPWDLAAAKITWVYGKEKQHEIMEAFLKNQDKWLIPSAFNKHNDAEKKKYADLVQKTLNEVSLKVNISVDEIKKKLSINDDDVCALLKLFAISDLNINIDLLEKVLKDDKLQRDLLLMTLKAKDDQGKLLTFTPAIYVQKHPNQSEEQGHLQKDNLIAEQINKLLDEALTEPPNG